MFLILSVAGLCLHCNTYNNTRSYILYHENILQSIVFLNANVKLITCESPAISEPMVTNLTPAHFSAQHAAMKTEHNHKSAPGSSATDNYTTKSTVQRALSTNGDKDLNCRIPTKSSFRWRRHGGYNYLC